MPQMPHLSMNIEGVPQYSSNVYWMWIFEQNCIHRSDMTFSAFRRFIGPCKISLPISQICRNGPFVNRQHGGNLRILVYPIPSSKLLHTAKSFEWSTCASKICCDSAPPRIDSFQQKTVDFLCCLGNHCFLEINTLYK